MCKRRGNLVDIQTEVTSRDNWTYILGKVQYQVSNRGPGTISVVGK